MKKILLTVLTVVLASSVLAGCSKEEAAGTDASPAAASPAATDTPAASPATTDTPTASPAATDAPAEVVAAVDLTDYPVMWCRERPVYSDTYYSSLASETYDSSLVLGTEWYGFRLIDDTHVECFMRFRFNDDIDTSIMIISQDESAIESAITSCSVEFYCLESITRINDREEEMIGTYPCEINGTELIITGEDLWGQPIAPLHFSSDFTSLTDGKAYEYTYHADF